jgi:ATP-dependent RNA helicase RhlE
MPFSKLGLSPSLCAPLARLGYTQPTPIQSAAIPIVLDGGDVLARAQTGTGKTAAFGLPMIARLLVRDARIPARPPRGLVLVPTRELAIQVHAALERYAASQRLRVVAIFGGAAMGPQITALRQGTDILVATPGRLLDHLQRRTVDLSRIEILTLDEADRMLDMGFLPALRRLIPVLPRRRQTLMFSATIAPHVLALAGEFTAAPTRIDISDGAVVASTVTHQVHPVAVDRKRDLLAHVLTQAPAHQALVFCRTKRGSNAVGDYLEGIGLKVAIIHGNKSQNARNRALRDFTTGRAAVLVATDIAARGLDIADLSLVVNYDLPLVAEDYVHRIGRTGRAGRQGRAVSLVTDADRGLLRDIQRLLPSPLEQHVVTGFEPLASRRPMPSARPGGPVSRRPRIGRPQRSVPGRGDRRALEAR